MTKPDNLIPKKAYTAPALKTFGSVESLTLGQGWAGDDDQWWFFHWGQDPPPPTGS